MLSATKLKITPEILTRISEIDTFKGRWAALEEHTTALNLIGDVASFGQNFKEVMEPLKHKEINRDMLVKLHMLVQRSTEPQGYKAEHMPIIVQQGDKIIGTLDTASPDEVEPLMNNVLKWLAKSQEDENFHPLLIIALFSAIFMQIGPFEKGNQKLMRLLVTLMMLKAGYNYAPYISFEQILMERSQAYFNALDKVQGNIEEGIMDFNPWILFFLECAQEQIHQLEQRMNKGTKDISNMPKLSIKVLKLFEKNERLQMKEIERLTRGRRSTLKLRLGELVEEGYLKRHGQARSTWYSRI
jgi:Fic family protein